MPFELITREDAHAKGLKRFFTGQPCKKKGHVAERFVINGGCCECTNWSSPHGRTKVQGRNVYWPERPMIYETAQPPTPEEKQATYNYMLACGWHYAALDTLRKDPELMEKHLNIIPLADVIRADVLINTRNRQVALLHAQSLGAKNAKPVTDDPEPSA